MKVFVVFILAIGCVSARGSGPYLPSGWKPDGPAFYLPSEFAKPDTSIDELQFQDTEPSGSEALREYGPPKLEEFSLSDNQGLPEVATEQAFLAEDKSESTVVAVEETGNDDANTLEAQKALDNVQEEEETTTQSQTADIIEVVIEQVTESSEVPVTCDTYSDVESLNVVGRLEGCSNVSQSEEDKLQEEVIQDTTTVVEEELGVPTTDDIIIPTSVKEEMFVPLSQQELVQDHLSAAVVTELVLFVDNEPKQIMVATDASEETGESDILTEHNLPQDDDSASVLESIEANQVKSINKITENEIKASEVANIGDPSSTQETSGTLEQAPESFLDYSPPGFAVYGPPVQEDLARLAAAEVYSDNNELRKRRFSPKLRSRTH